jgi:23S rRNA pseudouridine1911/1915/1917 synthase
MSLRRFYRGKRKADLSKVPTTLSLTVDGYYDGQRLDAYLCTQITWFSRTQIQRRIIDGKVRKNGRVVAAARRVRAGDQIQVDVPPPVEDLSVLEQIELPTLYEDEWFVAVDKPPHLLVHPVGRRRFVTALNILHKRYRRDDPREDVVPTLAHRIDGETTGVLLATKTKAAKGAITKLLMKQQVEKEYLALTDGPLDPPAGVIDLPLGPNREHEIHVTRAVDFGPDGQPARSIYRVERRLPGVDLVRVRLIHGRQHQVRVHMQAMGRPLIGDIFYGLRPRLTAADMAAAARVDPNPALPPAPAELPRFPAVRPDAPIRRTMLPADGDDPFANGTEAALLADPDRPTPFPPDREPGFSDEPGVLIDRLALHSARLAFTHPFTHEPVEISAPLPRDFRAVIDDPSG